MKILGLLAVIPATVMATYLPGPRTLRQRGPRCQKQATMPTLQPHGALQDLRWRYIQDRCWGEIGALDPAGSET
ncbi:MAG: hypothetical protein ACREDM_06415 [Methylocella sp.]